MTELLEVVWLQRDRALPNRIEARPIPTPARKRLTRNAGTGVRTTCRPKCLGLDVEARWGVVTEASTDVGIKALDAAMKFTIVRRSRNEMAQVHDDAFTRRSSVTAERIRQFYERPGMAQAFTDAVASPEVIEYPEAASTGVQVSDDDVEALWQAALAIRMQRAGAR